MGLNPKESLYYWTLFFWTLIKFPQKFPLAITLTVYGYHFRSINAKNRSALKKASLQKPLAIAIRIPV
jgi:hypothetical protein